MTNCVPPSLLIGSGADLLSFFPITAFLALVLRSTGPGVEIPKTIPGNSLLGDDELVPRTSSSNRPCSKNRSAIGCTTRGIFSGSISCFSPLIRLFISATGKGKGLPVPSFIGPYRFLSSASNALILDPAIAGTMLLI